jgi:Family of unknown function (DUF5995)
MTADALLARRLPGSVPGVLALMYALEQALPRRDGVRFFLTLYRAVTEDVHALVGPAGDYGDPRFVRWLDVVFAGLFFRALRDDTRRPSAVPKAWEPVFEARGRRRIAPIQFALAGMNAHINRDLPLALVQTWKARRIEPSRASVQYEDFARLNALFEQTEDRVKAELLTGALGHVDRSLGRADDAVAMWKVSRARECAWINAETLWVLRTAPTAAREHARALDRLVGLAGRGLLRPVG